jgi:hypothetical protein
MRNCTRCKGEKILHSQWAKDNGYEGPEGKPCTRCNGEGTYPEPDYKAIVEAVFTKRAPKRFRASMTSPFRKQGHAAARVYFVWRIVRFNAGLDVTLPMTAEMLIEGDPYRPELDALASYIAAKHFGHANVGRARWRSALLGEDAPEGLPDTAYESGPVQDGNKPSFESLELK